MDYLLLNVLILLMCLFLYFLLLFDRKFERKYQKLAIFSICAVGIITCMALPYYDVNGHIYDLRIIPFMIGALYGGRKVATFLFLVTLLYHFMMGGPGFNLPLLQTFMLLLLTLYINPNVLNLAPRKKVFATVGIMITLATATGIVYLVFLPDVLDRSDFTALLGYSMILIIAAAIIVFIIEFVLQNKRIEEEIIKTQKLRVVSELAASVSHEVRNPLTVTRGFIQLLYDFNIDKQKRVEFLNLSLQELDRAQAIISEYLMFAKPPEKINFTLLNLKDELSYIIQVMTPLAEIEKITLIDEGIEELFISGDKIKLRQCLINIMKNSIEATVNGGEIAIFTHSNEDKVTISIKDSGVGMSAKQLTKLGSPYFSTKEKGTGLGTTVIFTVVKAMDGRVKVESEEGKGTTFTLIFPSGQDQEKILIQ
ncbi:ATP-binding protein [Bacillaceae bacterium IKA-2]|nr:ATP-binding protein [Bacillaceae bacterium IKA-2]